MIFVEIEQSKITQGIFESASEEALKKVVRAGVTIEDDFYNRTVTFLI